ncbi:MAG: DMT family transporter [Gammaproteobacteria bacterium]
MHTTTGSWRLGLALALLTAVLWSVLPIVLKLLLGQMDAYTIVWYRFLAAAVLLGAFQMRRKALPDVSSLGRNGWLLLAVAVAGLMGNFVLYMIGLNLVTPGAAQMVVQLAPVLLLIGGLVVFRERFSTLQWLGFAVLIVGLSLFFNHRLEELFQQRGRYALGVLIVVAAAIAWAAYALAQKQLLKQLDSENIMLLIYVGGVFIFFPSADLGSVTSIDKLGAALLVFASLNTIFAYGAFAEALDHWEASRVSAVLAITPMLTLLWMWLLGPFINSISAEPLNALSLVGGALVVGGSVLVSTTGRQR